MKSGAGGKQAPAEGEEASIHAPYPCSSGAAVADRLSPGAGGRGSCHRRRDSNIARRRTTASARAGKPVDILLLHYTGMPSAERALNWLCDPEFGASRRTTSSSRTGASRSSSTEDRRAWHAGKSFWAGETDINSRSIGIEIANPGHEFGYVPFPDAQIAAVIALCRDILRRHPIPPERVLAHSDVAPLRKEDPGELFPWQTLHEAGIGHWVPPVADRSTGHVLQRGDSGAAVAALRDRFARYGYGLEPGAEFDAETEAVVRAFQRHFRTGAGRRRRRSVHHRHAGPADRRRYASADRSRRASASARVPARSARR